MVWWTTTERESDDAKNDGKNDGKNETKYEYENENENEDEDEGEGEDEDEDEDSDSNVTAAYDTTDDEVEPERTTWVQRWNVDSDLSDGGGGDDEVISALCDEDEDEDEGVATDFFTTLTPKPFNTLRNIAASVCFGTITVHLLGWMDQRMFHTISISSVYFMWLATQCSNMCPSP